MKKQFEELKKKHPDAILLFRVGDFYECLYEDAPVVAEILGICVSKQKDKLFAGFPTQALDTYLPKIIRAGKRVAICDKIDEPENKTKVKQSNEKKMEVKQLSLGSIAPSPMNPRKTFNEEDLKELATNIKNQGLLQPITVRPKDKSKYEIVCGERRYRACSINGMRFIPCIVKEMTDEEAFDAMITENLQRKDVDPMEEAFAFSQLVAQGKTAEEIALRFGKSQRFVQERIKLDKLIPELKKKVTDGEMAIGAAFIICKLTEKEQNEFLDRYGDDDEIAKADAEYFTNNLFMEIDRADWEDDFAGPCGCVCDKCQFNDANAGSLFYQMKEHDARCTCREKFEAKKYDWQLNIIRDNADVLVKAGEPLEAGKTVILYEKPDWVPDHIKAQNKKFLDDAKALGYECKLNNGEIFERYSSYHEDDERLQKMIADNEVYRCISVTSNYNGLHVMIRYYKFNKKATGEDADQAEAMKLVHERKEAIEKNGTNTAKKLRGLLGSMAPTDIKTHPLTSNETYILMCLLLADASYDFRKERNIIDYGDARVTITDYVKEHPEEVHQVAREYMRNKLAGSGAEYYSHLQVCQKLLIQEWKSNQSDEVIEDMERKLNEKLAKIDEKLTALGYDSEGKKLQ